MNGYDGQVGTELRTLQGMTPEERAALIGGEYVPERLAEFRRSRGSREGMLQGQIDSAFQIANTPIHIRGNTPAASMASMVANALRMFGGLALGKVKEKRLAEEEAESARLHEELMKRSEGASGAGLSVKQRGLSDALRGYGSGYET